MRRIFTLGLLVVMRPVLADFAEGVVAYQKGDYVHALSEFQTSAKFGNVTAQYNLGYMYAKGQGVAKNYEQAFLWFFRAAKNGDSEAQYHVAGMYENGLGVEQDYQQAMKWYLTAAEHGEREAQFTLGGLYGIGLGAPQSYKQSYAWFNVAAVQGKQSALQGRELAVEGIPPQQLAAVQAFSETIIKRYGRQER